MFGLQLQRDTERFVKEAGGKVLGSSAYPFPETTDFSSLLLQAQASEAKVLGLANLGHGHDQLHQAGARIRLMPAAMRLAAMLMYSTDVHALGLETAQGLIMTESFYWDLNDRTRAFMERIKPKTPNQWPNMVQAGDYAAACTI